MTEQPNADAVRQIYVRRQHYARVQNELMEFVESGSTNEAKFDMLQWEYTAIRKVMPADIDFLLAEVERLTAALVGAYRLCDDIHEAFVDSQVEDIADEMQRRIRAHFGDRLDELLSNTAPPP
jgi:hypothetical protein